MVSVLFHQLIQRAGGDYRPGRSILFHVWLSAHFAYLLGLMHYLDRAAAAALESCQPVLHVGRGSGTSGRSGAPSLSELRYRLTTMPRPAALWASLWGAVLGVGLPLAFIRGPASGTSSLADTFGLFRLSSSPLAILVSLVHLTLTQAILGALVYHTVRQLHMIDRIYAAYARVNLYRLQPLYAFSIPTALTAGGLVLYDYAWFGTAPELLSQPVSLSLSAFFAVVAAITFAWPLLGSHRRLVAEKRRMLAESSARFEATVVVLHQRVDNRALRQMDDFNKALASLEIEQTFLRRIPTWPWEPGTVRGLAAALGLPIVIWLIQFGLQRILQ